MQITLLGRTLDLIKARLVACKENRNQYVLGFLAKLICQGLFRSASTECAEVGHPHHIQDQRFSIVATTLARQPVLQYMQATLDMMR